jgi:NAD(P)H dehydrogenase (quinone)
MCYTILTMLIIYAHPNKEGHCGEVLQQSIDCLEAEEISYELLDLYEMGFDPVMPQKEHYTSGGKDVDLTIEKLQKLFKQHERFLFIYPTWWNNVPAILKGVLDRVFTNHFAFEYRNKIPVGLLNGKAAVITTTGAPRPFGKVLMRDRSLSVVTKDTLKFCGIKPKGYIIGSCTEYNDKQKQKIEKAVARALTYLA